MDNPEGELLYSVAMSKAEILQELPRLTREERGEIVAKARELDGEAWIDPAVTETEKRILDAELEEFARNPDAGSTWPEVEARIRQGQRR
jgi:hypothetical protein